jgi:hypothetical protein
MGEVLFAHVYGMNAIPAPFPAALVDRGTSGIHPLRSGSTYQGKIPRNPSPELPLLAGHESHRIIVSDAKGLRRRAELLLALANKAREDNYTQLADYILDRADQLFEEARIRELG